MKKGVVRIKDIAERAGVSKGTVDRVLHNRGRVADDVRENILKIIKELEYEPNVIAQSLKSQRTYSLIALIPNPDADDYWKEPYMGLLKAERELRQYGVSITSLVFDPHDKAGFVARAREVTNASPDGVLVAPIFYKEVFPFFEAWEKQQIPYVLFNTQITGANALSYIGQDSYKSGLLAGKLLSFGLEAPTTLLVVHINEDISNSAHLITKEEGFRDYFREHDPEGRYHVVRGVINFNDPGVFDGQMRKILNDEPALSGIYVTTSKAFEIASYFEKNNIHHIKLIGYDLLDRNLNFLQTEMIQFLINQNPFGQGYWGIHQLANHLVFRKTVEPIKFLPLDVVTRENVEYFVEPTED